MLMAGFVCLAAAQVAEIRTNPERIRPFVFLGIFLGLSYFSKTIMFSISVMLLGFFAVLVPRTWRSGVKVALAVGLFLLLALPFIMLISERKGKATFGEVGAVTYLRHVQGIPYPHWQGDSDGDVVLAHPSRQVYADPPIFEFDGPIGGTYPPSTEPSYWYDGVKVEINLKNQLSRILISGLYYLDVFANQLGILLGCTAAFYLIGLTQKTSPREIVRKWALTILGLYALVQYGLVLVLGRFLGVFVLLIWADFMTNVRVLKNVSNRLAVNGLSIVAVLGILLSLLGFNLAGLNRMDLISQPDVDSTITASAAKPLAVAQELQRLQIGPGSKAGVIGYGFDSYWARLARVQIVAEMLDRHAGRFWEGDAAQRQAAMQAFKGTGIDVVVAEHVPPYVRMDGWHRVGESNYYIYTFGAE
jgi:hypothetical protein